MSTRARNNSGNGNATRATMIDVAQAAGVSLKTVSRVINGEAGVSQKTIDTVLQASSALRYERNDLAASLRHGDRSQTLGLIIEDVTNPFYSTIAQAVEQCARARSSLLITASAREDAAREQELVTALLRRRVDALLVVPAGTDHRYITESGFNTNAVFIDRPPSRTTADTVLTNNRAGAKLAVAHLLEGGHDRIAFIGDDLKLYTARERLAGYRRALSDAGIAPDPDLIYSGISTSDAATRAVSELAALPTAMRPTAIFTGNNRCTVGALHALGPRRKRTALIGFDDFELADLLEITVVRTDPQRIGTVAAEIAFARIDGDENKPRRVTVPVELVPRGSGELAA